MKQRNRETLALAITEAMRIEIWNRFLKGKETMEEIGKSIGKSRQTIGYHINKTMEEFHSHNMTAAGLHIQRELEICNKGAADAWKLYYKAEDAFEASKGNHKVETVTGKALNTAKGKPRKDGKILLDTTSTEIQTKTEESAGDPRFLKLMLEAQELIREWHIRRCKIQGFEAPKTQINIGGDVNITSARQYIISELTLIASRQGTGANS